MSEKANNKGHRESENTSNGAPKDDPFLRNTEANADIFIGGDTKLLAEKRLDAIKRSRQVSVSKSSYIDKTSASPSDELHTPGTSETKWIQLGPTSIHNGQTYSPRGTRVLVTGRVTAIVPHPHDPKTIYAGAAQGGIWKTVDGGRNWKPTSDDQNSLAIGALAIDESNPLVLYAGTGEGNFSGDSQYGYGILKTTDGGETWVNKAFDTFFTSRFCRLAINHKTSTTIFAAVGSSVSPDVSAGIYRSIDGGDTWSRMENGLPSIDRPGATDIVLDPANADIAYAAFWEDGIYKTTEVNADNPKWVNITRDLPTHDMLRIVLGISKSSPNTLYALMSNAKRIIDKFYCSDDGGSSWRPIILPGNNIGGQGTYNINLAIHPHNKDVVYLSGISVWKAVRNSSNDTWSFSNIGEEIHPDNHAFAFNPLDPRIIYAGNDGGIYQSNDEGSTWVDSINEGLCITQFSFMEQHPTSDAVILSGTQDNGTIIYRNNPAFYHSAGGDGGFCAIDHINTNNYVHTYYGPDPELSAQAGKFRSWRSIEYGLPPFENPDRSRNFLFYPPIALDKTNPMNIALGGKMLYLDKSQGVNGWSDPPIPLPNTKGFVSAINYVNSNLIYLATFGGSVYRLTKSANEWKHQAIDSNPLPSRPIWDVATLPNDNTKVIVILAGFGTPHVFYGDIPLQGVAKWTDISGTGDNRIPDIPVNALVIEDDKPDTMYVGTDAGVWRTIDGGKNWTPFNQGLPNTQVYDMRLHSPTRLLRVVTHGRGMWQRRLDTETMNNINIFVRDNIMDTGLFIPSPTDVNAVFEDEYQGISLGQKMKSSMCSDIKIDSPDQSSSYQMDIETVDYTKFENKLFNRNIRRGKVNRVYVQIHNRGIKDVSKATIKILYGNYTDGWYKLPDDFWIQFPNDSNDTAYWKPIGEAKVLPSPPKTLTYTEPTILSWEWSAPSDISNDIGLLVVVDSIDDPIPPETKKIFIIDDLVSNEKHVGLRVLKVTD